jgi:hypothetical protein
MYILLLKVSIVALIIKKVLISIFPVFFIPNLKLDKMKEPILYSLGFIFSLDHKNVLLIKKKSPEEQKGLYNGIGGAVKLLEQESPITCMYRTCEKETGLKDLNWIYNGFFESKTLAHPSIVYLFSTRVDSFTITLPKKEEKLYWYTVEDIITDSSYLVNHVSWLVPLILNQDVTKIMVEVF